MQILMHILVILMVLLLLVFVSLKVDGEKALGVAALTGFLIRKETS